MKVKNKNSQFKTHEYISLFLTPKPMHSRINIAIDGFSSCGKSTLAKRLAAHFNYVYIDSGAMYRAVTLFAMENGMVKDNFLIKDDLIKALSSVSIDFKHNAQTGKSETYLNGENVEKDIRGMQVSNNVSKVSLIKEVRQKLISLQQQLGISKGVVMDGRDIGTAVFPDAELKIFMTADNETRVKRRFEELRAKGAHVTMDEVQKNIASRDHSDTTRDENPLVRADDALILDNSDLTQDEQFHLAKSWVENKIQLTAADI